MGAIEGFSKEQLKAPELWRKFVANRDGILMRLSRQFADPGLPESCGLTRYGEIPAADSKLARDYRGILWGPRDAGPDNATFWYFLGFRYSDLEWQPALLQPGQPECAVFVGCWGESRIEEFLEEELRSRRLDAIEFEVQRSQEGQRIFLCRRRSLNGFTESSNQSSDIHEFFKQSHDALCAVVPEVRKRHLELVANRQRPQQN